MLEGHDGGLGEGLGGLHLQLDQRPADDAAFHVHVVDRHAGVIGEPLAVGRLRLWPRPPAAVTAAAAVTTNRYPVRTRTPLSVMGRLSSPSPDSPGVARVRRYERSFVPGPYE